MQEIFSTSKVVLIFQNSFPSTRVWTEGTTSSLSWTLHVHAKKWKKHTSPSIILQSRSSYAVSNTPAFSFMSLKFSLLPKNRQSVITWTKNACIYSPPHAYICIIQKTMLRGKTMILYVHSKALLCSLLCFFFLFTLVFSQLPTT